MDDKRTVEKLEHDLSHFLIGEMCKKNPEKRGSPEMYKYRGLSIRLNSSSVSDEKTFFVRIGAFEAEFKIDSCEKNFGALSPEEERLIMIWMKQSDNNYLLKSMYVRKNSKKEILIVPFDLENYYDKI